MAGEYDWTTARNNHAAFGGESLRVVWDRDGSDICYVVPCDGDNGNNNARLIANAPNVLKHASRLCDIIYRARGEMTAKVISAYLALSHAIKSGGVRLTDESPKTSRDVGLGYCFDFGPGFAVVEQFLSRIGVEIHVQSGHALSPYECRRLAEFLMEAADAAEAMNTRMGDPVGSVVYAITDGKNHKVGKAVSLKKRIKQLQTGNGNTLKLVCYVPATSDTDAYMIESSVHQMLSDDRSVGEWFSCNSHTVYNAMIHAANAATPSRKAVNVCVGHDDEPIDDDEEAAS